MVNYGRKKCKICGDKLIKKGFDTANNQIWYCKHCHRHYVFKRKDNHDRLWIYRYIDFLSENKKIEDFNVSKSTFYRKIKKFRNTNIFLPEDNQQYDQIFVDALWLKRKCCYLIARTNEYVIGFAKYDSERYETWLDFLKKFKAPKYVVCDGQNGLMKAISNAWPKTLVQHCQFHVIMNGRQKLTKHPKPFKASS